MNRICRIVGPVFRLVIVAGALLTQSASADHPDTTVFQAYGYVRTSEGNAVEGVNVLGDNYIGDVYPSVTDSNGYYQVIFPTDGNYRLGVDCQQLTTRGFTCPAPVGMAQEGDPIEIDFIVTAVSTSLRITNSTVPTGIAGGAYSFQLVAEGGALPYRWTLADDSAPLPAGLTFSMDGLISGVPQSFSVGTVKILVTDANSVSAEKLFQLVINPRPLLTPIGWLTNRFTLRISGAPRQNYTLQFTTNRFSEEWNSLLTTNHPEVGTFLVRDPGASNGTRFYRLLVGP